MKINLKFEKKKILIIFGALIALALLITFVISNEKRNAQKELERIASFEAEQEQRLNSIKEENKKLSEEAAKKEHEQHEQLQKLIDSGSLTTAPIKNNCSRLSNREAIILLNKNLCTYKLKAIGKANMAVVFISDGQDYSADIAEYRGGQASQSSFLYMNEFMKREAARRDNPLLEIQMDFYGPFQQMAEVQESNADLDDTQKLVDNFQGASLQNNVPESEYDMVHYIYLPKNRFRSFALPANHRAITNAGSSTSGVFIHETLHLLGASDKYNNNDCATRGRGDPFNPNSTEKDLTDIMCTVYGDLNIFNINTITAREIGWLK